MTNDLANPSYLFVNLLILIAREFVRYKPARIHNNY